MLDSDSRKEPSLQWLSGAALWATIVLVVGVLYWAREVLIPIAMAVLLTFVLAPIVSVLRRRGLGRRLAVFLTVVLAFIFIGAIGTVVFVQFGKLADELPAYRQNILQKVSDIRVVSNHGPIQKIQETMKAIVTELKKGPAAPPKNPGAVPVVVTDRNPSLDWKLPRIAPLLEPMATGALAVVLVIFMLARREDLRDRIVRLVGDGHLARATKAIDEAGKRVSSYLLRLCLVNTGFGVGVSVGLFFIGVPYATLWGVFAGAARFIPYVGPWLGAAGPLLLSITVLNGWTPVLLVFGVFVVLEVINNFLLEPVIYSQSIGVSEMALLVMIAFWTWLWGPIGMVLANPLTVCLMVISKSIPDLQFIYLLLGSEPALKPQQVFYQRLIAKDQEEARRIVKRFFARHSRLELFQQVLIPTLVACRRDRARGCLTEEDLAYAFQAIGNVMKWSHRLTRMHRLRYRASHPEAKLAQKTPMERRALFLGCPARDEAERYALLMLADELRSEGCVMRVLRPGRTVNDYLSTVRRARPDAVCIGVLPDGSLEPVRGLCERLRSSFPDLTIMVGLWDFKHRRRMPADLADVVSATSSSLLEAKKRLLATCREHRLLPNSSQRERTPALVAEEIRGVSGVKIGQ